MFEFVIHGFLCCERIMTETNGSKRLIGVFQSLHVAHMPVTDLVWHIYIALGSVAKGTHPFILTIAYSRTSEEVVSSSGEMQVNNERADVELILPMSCKFSHYGAYVMTLEVRGEPVASRILRIEREKDAS